MPTPAERDKTMTFLPRPSSAERLAATDPNWPTPQKTNTPQPGAGGNNQLPASPWAPGNAVDSIDGLAGCTACRPLPRRHRKHAFVRTAIPSQVYNPAHKDEVVI